MAEGLVEAGGIVHCLDRAPESPKSFEEAKARTEGQSGGSLTYHQVDVTQDAMLEDCIAGIAAEKMRLNGLIAGMWQRCRALFWNSLMLLQLLVYSK